MFYIDVLIESRERTSYMSKELQIRNSTVDFLVFTRDAGEDGIRSQGSEWRCMAYAESNFVAF